MFNIELNSKVRLSLPLLAIAGAVVAARILKEKGTNIPAIDEITDKVKSYMGSCPFLGKFTKTDDVHAAIAMALVDSGLVGQGEGASIAARTTIKPRTQVQSAWSSKVQTLRRYPGQM